MEKIHVGLYGGKNIFGGREHPLRAEIIYCDKKDHCSFYEQGYCLNVTSVFSSRCKNGKIEMKKGYTSRAKKYSSFKYKYKEDELYGVLSYPKNKIIAYIDDFVFINATFVQTSKIEGNYVFKDGYAINSRFSWIEKKDFTVDLFSEFFKKIPKALMGGEIKEYRAKILPELLFQLQELDKDFYDKFITAYPEFNKEVSHIGKKAYINSLKDGVAIKSSHGIFKVDRNFLVSEDWRSAFLPFNAKTAEVKIKITDKMTVEITSDDQVDKDTIFE